MNTLEMIQTDPMGFRGHYDTPGGIVTMHVEYRHYDAHSGRRKTLQRQRPGGTPLLTVNQDYHVAVPGLPPGHPLGLARCTFEFYPKQDRYVSHHFVDAIAEAQQRFESEARDNGVILHPDGAVDHYSYWMTRDELRREREFPTRLSPAERAYQTGSSLPEPVAVALHHHLLHHDEGFQLTLDGSAPKVELEHIVADDLTFRTAHDAVEYLEAHEQAPDATPRYNAFRSLAITITREHWDEPDVIPLPCLPLDRERRFLHTDDAPVELIHHLLVQANGPHDDQVGRDAFVAAWRTKLEKHPELAHRLARMADELANSVKEEISKPITVTAGNGAYRLTLSNAE